MIWTDEPESPLKQAPRPGSALAGEADAAHECISRFWAAAERAEMEALARAAFGGMRWSMTRARRTGP